MVGIFMESSSVSSVGEDEEQLKGSYIADV